MREDKHGAPSLGLCLPVSTLVSLNLNVDKTEWNSLPYLNNNCEIQRGKRMGETA